MEQVYLNEGPVFVSSARVVLHGVTYVVGQINSVRLITTPPNSLHYLLSAALFLIGGFCGIACMAVCSSAPSIGGALDASSGPFMCFLVLTGLSIMMWRNNKATYAIGLTTSSGEVVAIRNRDYAAVHHLLSAIQHAIVARG